MSQLSTTDFSFVHERYCQSNTATLTQAVRVDEQLQHAVDKIDIFPSKEYTQRRRLVEWEIPMFSRTWKQWFLRILFYLVFVISYELFYLGAWALYMASVDITDPAFSQYIMLEPGLNFRPRPRNGDWGALLHYNRRDKEGLKQLLESMNEAVKMYEEERILDDPNGDHHTWTKVCSFDRPADDEYACWIDTRAFGTYCYRTQLYGFDDGKPCILIRINRVNRWVPDPYQSFEELKAAGFPLDWKEEDFTPGFLPISCEGQTDVDKELLGPMKYYYPLRPYNGIASYYYPFNGQLHFAPPGVMVNFYNLTFAVPIRIICKLWARNVQHRREGPTGTLSGAVEFELMVDSGIIRQD